ncbi:MAG TPA: hypothetical protein VF167_10775 [Longimicrobiaceae bacterium]
MENEISRRPPDEESPSRDSLSRRELLRRAGWAVPAIIALPLMPGTAHAHRHASPGAKSPSKGSHDRSWSYGSDYRDWNKKKQKKEAIALTKLLKKLFGWR